VLEGERCRDRDRGWFERAFANASKFWLASKLSIGIASITVAGKKTDWRSRKWRVSIVS